MSFLTSFIPASEVRSMMKEVAQSFIDQMKIELCKHVTIQEGEDLITGFVQHDGSLRAIAIVVTRSSGAMRLASSIKVDDVIDAIPDAHIKEMLNPK